MSGGGLDIPGTLRIPVSVVVERRPGATPWAEWSWRAVEVLEGQTGLPPWTVLREEAGRTLFLAGNAEVELHPTDTANYRDNLQADPPLIWAVLREADEAPGLRLYTVTVDAGEAHLYADAGSDLLEALPMPSPDDMDELRRLVCRAAPRCEIEAACARLYEDA